MQSVRIHVDGRMRKIEDLLLISQSYRDLKKPKQVPKIVLLKIKILIEELLRFVNGIMGQSRNVDLKAQEKTLVIYEMCRTTMEEHGGGQPAASELKKIQKPSTSLDNLVDLIKGIITMNEYKRVMKRCISKARFDAHRHNTLELADVCVIHSIVISCLHHNNPKKYDFLQEARDTYSRSTNGNHKRLLVLDQCLIASHLSTIETKFLDFDMEEEANSLVDLEWILSQDDFVKKMIIFGIASCEKSYS
jgi:hypothetical protein